MKSIPVRRGERKLHAKLPHFDEKACARADSKCRKNGKSSQGQQDESQLLTFSKDNEKRSSFASSSRSPIDEHRFPGQDGPAPSIRRGAVLRTLQLVELKSNSVPGDMNNTKERCHVLKPMDDEVGQRKVIEFEMADRQDPWSSSG
jgi:hypothetical protein